MATDLRQTSDLRARTCRSLGSFERQLTECLLRLDSEGVKETIAQLRQLTYGPGNLKYRVRRGCKKALLHVEADLRAGRKDARQVASLVAHVMDAKLHRELLDDLGLQHVALS